MTNTKSLYGAAEAAPLQKPPRTRHSWLLETVPFKTSLFSLSSAAREAGPFRNGNFRTDLSEFAAIAVQIAKLLGRSRRRVLIRLIRRLRNNRCRLGEKVVQRLQPKHLGLEDAAEVSGHRSRYLFQRNRSLQLALHRSNRFAGDATRHDQGEEIEISGDVQGETMGGH